MAAQPMRNDGTYEHTSPPSSAGLRVVDVIWNLTLVCPWYCEQCCVVAVQAIRRGETIAYRADGPSDIRVLPYRPGEGSHFDQLAKHWQALGLELDLAGKLNVLENLR